MGLQQLSWLPKPGVNASAQTVGKDHQTPVSTDAGGPTAELSNSVRNLGRIG